MKLPKCKSSRLVWQDVLVNNNKIITSTGTPLAAASVTNWAKPHSSKSINCNELSMCFLYSPPQLTSFHIRRMHHAMQYLGSISLFFFVSISAYFANKQQNLLQTWLKAKYTTQLTWSSGALSSSSSTQSCRKS